MASLSCLEALFLDVTVLVEERKKKRKKYIETHLSALKVLKICFSKSQELSQELLNANLNAYFTPNSKEIFILTIFQKVVLHPCQLTLHYGIYFSVST